MNTTFYLLFELNCTKTLKVFYAKMELLIKQIIKLIRLDLITSLIF